MTHRSDKAEVAKGPPGLTHSAEEWLKKSSGPGKVRYVPLSLPGGRVLQHLVCVSMSIQPIFLDSNSRVRRQLSVIFCQWEQLSVGTTVRGPTVSRPWTTVRGNCQSSEKTVRSCSCPLPNCQWIYAVLLLSVVPVGPGGGINSIIENVV